MRWSPTEVLGRAAGRPEGAADAGGEGSTDFFDETAAKDNADALEKIKASGKVQVHVLTDAEKKAWVAKLMPVHKRCRAGSARTSSTRSTRPPASRRRSPEQATSQLAPPNSGGGLGRGLLSHVVAVEHAPSLALPRKRERG
jgi:hypothetical protein